MCQVAGHATLRVVLELVPALADHRRHDRVPTCDGLCAALRPPSGIGSFVSLSDLSAGGMGLEHCPPLEPDAKVRFELWGSGFAWSGTARVAHVGPESAGLEFVGWDGPVHRPLGRLLADIRHP